MHAIGVDIGGTKIAAGVVDEDGTILAQTRRDTSPDDVAGIDKAIAEVYLELSGSYEIGAVGVAAAGFVSADRSSVLFAPNIAWRDYPLRQKVQAILGDDDVLIVVENDANAAGWAEFQFGAARDVDDMLMLTVGTGLGGAIVSDGKLVRGAWGVAAEIGHMRVVPGGHYCGCGHEGCWEQYASGSALVRDAQATVIIHPERATRLLELAGGNADKLTGPQVTQAAQEGDPLAVELLTELGRWVGEGAASADGAPRPRAHRRRRRRGGRGRPAAGTGPQGFAEQLSGRGHRPEAAIVVASMGNDAGLVGAADLARG